MNINEKMVRKISITGIDDLDPINVVFENFAPGQGRVIVECFGKSWANYWGSMGATTVEKFIIDADEEYIARKLYDGTITEIDYDTVGDTIGELITNNIDIMENQDEIAEAFGPDWRLELPIREKNDYLYLRKIIATIQQALKSNDKFDMIEEIANTI